MPTKPRRARAPSVRKRTVPSDKSGRTRLALVAAAERVFTRHGYLNTEIAHITREADRATGTFYVYFDNKLEILKAMVAEFTEDLKRSGLDQPEHPPEAAPQVLRALWTTYRKHSATFRALVQAAAVDPEMTAIYDELRERARRDYRSMLKGSRDAELTAAALDLMISSCLYEWLAIGQPRNFDEERAFHAMLNIVSRVLGV